jgi:DHA2 family multidrug resistance protein
LVLAGLVAAALLEVMDVTITNVALPQMAGNLGATTEEIAWVSTAYTLANAVLLPMTAWLAHRFGRRRYLLASIAAFTLGSFLCGLSHSLPEIIAWRVLQGASGAALISTGQATLVQIFPAREQGLVQSVFGFSLVASPAFAPWLGGWITDNYLWPWVFFVNVPVGLAAALLVGGFLHEEERGRMGKGAGPVDWAGIGLLAAGLGSLQYVLEEGQRHDWFRDRGIAVLSIIAGASLTALLAWELWPGNRSPIMDLRVYRERSLSTGVSLSFATGFGLYGGAFLLPQFTQNVLGFTPTAAGLALIPEGVATLVAVALCGVLLGRGLDPRWPIAAGMGLAGAGLWLLTGLTAQSGLADTRLGLIVEGAGVGLLIIPISLASFGDLRGRQIAEGAAQHRAALVSHLDAGSLPLAERLTGLTGHLAAQGLGAMEAQRASLAMLNGVVQRQALTLAYLDAFWLLCASYLLCIPSVLLLKRPSPEAKSAGITH